MSHAAEYVIVAGVAWLRRSSEADWAVTYDDARVRRGRGSWLLERTRAVGELDGLAWELEFAELAPPFRTPQPLLRPVASTQLETWPALLVSGVVGGRTVERAPGHRARLWGRRLAESWRWTHASLPDGRWAHALTVKPPGLPLLSQHGGEGRTPSLRPTRAHDEGTHWRVGPYLVDADHDSFVRLAYRDRDGTELHCYHSGAARLTGPALSVDAASYEIACRHLLPELEPHR